MQQVVNQILNVFEGYRMPPTPKDQYEQTGKKILAEKMESFVASNKPIEFAMLGFPFKSTNTRDKVLGILPDRAEEETLKNFTAFDLAIKQVYPAGVKLHMVSDGYVFNDLLGVSDKVVADYKEISMSIGKDAPVAWHDLSEFYSSGTLDNKRGKVIEQFGVTAEKLERDIQFDDDVNFLYRGMIRFMTEELAMQSFPSGNQLQKAAKKLAREMMFRNEAYSNLVRKEFAPMIRLSMHPSINNGSKYSFQLIPSPKAHHSAWHCVLVVNDNGEMETMHKKEAIESGFELVNQNGQPYYFHS